MSQANNEMGDEFFECPLESQSLVSFPKFSSSSCTIFLKDFPERKNKLVFVANVNRLTLCLRLRVRFVIFLSGTAWQNRDICLHTLMIFKAEVCSLVNHYLAFILSRQVGANQVMLFPVFKASCHYSMYVIFSFDVITCCIYAFSFENFLGVINLFSFFL